MKMLGKSSLSSKLKRILDVAWYVSLAVAAIAVVAVPLIAYHRPSGGDHVKMSLGDIHFEMEPQTALRSSEGVTAYISKGAGELTVNGALNASTVAVVVVAMVVLAGLHLFTIWQLRHLFRTFVEGNPFVPSNVRRLRTIAISILSLALASSVFSSVMTYMLAQQFRGDGIRLVARGDASLSTLFAAAVLFVLAEIFRLGSHLEDEKAHTV